MKDGIGLLNLCEKYMGEENDFYTDALGIKILKFYGIIPFFLSVVTKK